LRNEMLLEDPMFFVLLAGWAAMDMALWRE
jgi:hypothetical protein